MPPPNVRTNARTAQELAITHAQMGPMSESANCTSLFFRYSIDLTSRWLIRIRQGSRYTQRSRWQAPKERYGVQSSVQDEPSTHGVRLSSSDTSLRQHGWEFSSDPRA